jgi:hypothetical protein
MKLKKRFKSSRRYMQMKKRNVAGIISLALVFFLTLSGCQQPEALSSDATIASVTVAGVQAVSLGTPSENWLEAVENSGHIYLTAAQFTDAAVSAATNASGATVFFSPTKPGILPNFVEDTVLNFDANDVLFVEVFSPNLDTFLIYAIQIHKKTPVISDIGLGGRSASGGVQLNGIPIQQFGAGMGTPGLTWNDPGIVEGAVWFGTSQEGTALALTVTPESPGITYQYAVVSNSATDPTNTFADPPDPFQITVANGSYLYIKSISDNSEYGDTVYYKVKLVSKKDDRSLTSVTINGVTFGIGAMGTHSFPGSEAWGAYSNGAELATNGSGYMPINTTLTTKDNPVIVTATPTDPALAILYGHTAVERDYNVEFGTNANLGTVPTNEFIGLEVKSELGEKGWYKFRVYVGRTENTLSAITIPGGSGSITVPTPNTAVTGTTASAYTMSAAGPWSPTVTVNVSGGAQVAYALAATSNANITAWTNTTGVFEGIVSAQYVVIRVISENGQNTNYYKVRLLYGSNNASLTSITIPGGVGAITVPAANTAVTGTTASTYTMSAAGPWSPTVTVVPGQINAQIAYAVAAAINTNITAWTNTTGVFDGIVSAQYVVIRVISQDNTVTSYYKVRLLYGSNDSSLTSITIPGGVGAITVPAANTAVTGTTASTYTMSAAGPWSPTVTVVPGEPNAQAAYAVAAAINTNITDWANTTGALTDILSAQYVVIRITSQDNTVASYYKVRLLYGNSGAALSTLSVGGVAASIGTAQTSAPTAEPAEGIRGAITLTPAQLGGSAVPVLNADPSNTGATVDYARGYIAVGADWKGNPTYTWTVTAYTAAVPVAIQNGEYLVVRVTSQDRTVVLYHNILVTIPE